MQQENEPTFHKQSQKKPPKTNASSDPKADQETYKT